MNTEVEVIDNMPFDEYLALDRLSSSALKNFIECPHYYKWLKTQPQKEPSAAFKKGTMIHTWMLENHTFQNLYYSMPDTSDKKPAKPPKPEGANGRAKAGTPEKELYLEFKKEMDAYDLENDEYNEVIRMYEEAAGDREIWPEAEINRYSKLPSRTDTRNEVTVLFEINGIPCKARFDMLHMGEGVEDLKTIADIFKIDRDFFKFKYHVQAGFYTLAYKAAFGEWPDFFKFTFVSTGDYPTMVTRDCEFSLIEFSRSLVENQVTKFKECIETNHWPKLYSGEIELPAWM